MNAGLDGIAKWSIEDKIISFRRDGVLAKLVHHAKHASDWGTRITIIAYRRGRDAGIDGCDVKQNPYREGDSNFQKGANNAWKAWGDGWLDGSRIRTILDNPASDSIFPPLTQAEYRHLPPSLQAIADANPVDKVGAAR